MKKQLIFPLFAALVAMGTFSACSNGAPKDKLQEPNASLTTETVNANDAEKNEPGAPASTTTVISNLTDAFKGETSASAKYAAYSKKAQEEGYPQIAMLFKAASASEKIHANNHQAVLEDMGASIPIVKPAFSVKTTQDNLQDAIAGESYEISTMYPEFLANAKTAGAQLAMISLNYAYKTEQKHKLLYDKALAALQKGQVNTLSLQYYICPTCGNTYDSTPPKRCGISMTSAEKFIRIESV
jgi:rubrerythrin